MKPDKFTALYTECQPREGSTAADLLVIFAHRDAQTAQDVTATQTHLAAEGYGVHVRHYDFNLFG